MNPTTTIVTMSPVVTVSVVMLSAVMPQLHHQPPTLLQSNSATSAQNG